MDAATFFVDVKKLKRFYKMLAIGWLLGAVECVSRYFRNVFTLLPTRLNFIWSIFLRFGGDSSRVSNCAGFCLFVVVFFIFKWGPFSLKICSLLMNVNKWSSHWCAFQCIIVNIGNPISMKCDVSSDVA